MTAPEVLAKVLVFRSVALAGSETFIHSQLQALRRWHGVLVAERPAVAGLPLDGLRVRWLAPQVPRWLRQLRRRVPLWRDGAWARDVAVLRSEHAALLHVHFGTDAVEAAPLARALGVPMLVTLHGFDVHVAPAWWASGAGGRLMRRYPQRLRQLARQPRVGFIAVSHAVRDSAIAFGLPAERIAVSPIGVDVQRIRPAGVPLAQRRRRVLFVGRLVEKKGAAILLRAFAGAAVPGAELQVIGDGPLRSDLQNLARKMSVPATFLGAQPHARVLQEMAAARVFCLPSITAANGDAEGLNTTVMEAQAAGLPVVTSARASTTEGMLDGVTGIAFAEHDEAALAHALRRLLTDDAAAQAMADAGPRFVAARFDIRRCTAALEALYDAAVAAPAPCRQ